MGGTWGPEEDSGATTTCFGTRRRRREEEENEAVCAEFHSFRSLSAAGKRKALAHNYCVGEDHGVAREDMYHVLLTAVVQKLDGMTLSAEVVAQLGGIDTVLTCDAFHNAYMDVRHLPLCKNKHQHLAIVPARTKKRKKQKKTSEDEKKKNTRDVRKQLKL